MERRAKKQNEMADQLFDSLYQRDLDKIKKLIKKGVSINSMNTFGQTPLMMAAVSGDAELVELFINNGALVDAPVNGMIPLEAALYNGSYPRKNFIPEYENFDKTVKLLIDKVAIVSEIDKNGYSFLHKYSRRFGKILIEYGADVNAQALNGITPLMLAAERGDEKSVVLLIENGADVNAADAFGKTALMYAAACEGIGSYLKVLETLIENGANVEAKDINGKTALIYFAESRKNIYTENDFTNLFLQNNAKVPEISGLDRDAQTYLKQYKNAQELKGVDKELKTLDKKQEKDTGKGKE